MRAVTRPGRRSIALAGLMLAIAVAWYGPAVGATAAEPSRILVVDSYHPGYPWGDGIRRGIHEALDLVETPKGHYVSRDGSLIVQCHFMDSKRHQDAASLQRSTQVALEIIGRWRPDVVILQDDNAVKHVLVPHFRGSDLPFVFCGVNWDASIYGLPWDNVTGMVEVGQVEDLVRELRRHATGDRVGYLFLDRLSARRETEVMRERFFPRLLSRSVPDFDSWKQEFDRMQDEVDILLVGQNITGVDDWDRQDAIRFTQEITRIPTGTTTPGTLDCVLVSFIKSAHEEGVWAATTALEILDGRAPRDIPLVESQEARVYLNMTLARKLGIRFGMDLIERATFVEEGRGP